MSQMISLHSPVADLRSIRAAADRGLRPAPRITVSEHAERTHRLPSTASEPGPFRLSRVPYLREPLDCLSPSHPAEEVSVMKGTQGGWTEAGLVWVNFVVVIEPGLMMMVNPGREEVKRNTRARVNPMIEAVPEVKALISERRSRDGGNSVFQKDFPGGSLVMTGAQSASGLAATPVRYLFLDQIDQYPADVDGEGDPVALAERRTTTFRANRKIYKVGTPTIEGRSRIQAAFEEGDQRRYFVPCKSCGEFDYLRWEDIKWPEGDPRRAGWMCPSCGTLHRESDKPAMLLGGEWRATAESDTRKVSFHWPALLSPWETWGDQAEDFLTVKNDPDRFRVWVNTVLGEPYQERGDAPEWERIYERREDYTMGSIPEGVLLLTAGVDVQQDRLEVEVVGWGRDRQSWSIEYRVLPGDTANLDSEAWQDLAEMLDESWPLANGVQLQLRRLAIDEGYNTMEVRAWARSQNDRSRILVCKGTDNEATPLGVPRLHDINRRGKRISRGMQVWPVGVSLLKTQLYRWLRLPKPTDEDLEAGEGFPPGYCHMPQYGEEHFRQLTAEQRIHRKVRGYSRWQWEKIYERNERLDCRVYARAAAIQAGADRWNERSWDGLEEDLGGPVAPGEEPRVVGAGRRRRRRGVVKTKKSSYMNRGR